MLDVCKSCVNNLQGLCARFLEPVDSVIPDSDCFFFDEPVYLPDPAEPDESSEVAYVEQWFGLRYGEDFPDC